MKNMNITIQSNELEIMNNIEAEITVSDAPQRKGRFSKGRQGGFTLYDFIFWMVVASIALLAVIGFYNKASGMLKVSTTTTDVTQIKAAVEDWRGARTDLTGVDIGKICGPGFGNKGASWCGAGQNGKKANPYGGDYSVIVSSANVSQIDISISQVPADSVSIIANKLAPMSVERCASMPCTSVTEGTTTKVTM